MVNRKRTSLKSQPSRYSCRSVVIDFYYQVLSLSDMLCKADVLETAMIMN